MIRSSPAEHSAFRDLATEDDLDRCLQASHTRAVLIYKHSLTCSTSGFAAEEVAGWLDAAAPSLADVYVVRVQAARHVSQAIASRLSVRHESPQVLLVVAGVSCWHASHFSVTAAAIDDALRRIAGTAG